VHAKQLDFFISCTRRNIPSARNEEVELMTSIEPGVVDKIVKKAKQSRFIKVDPTPEEIERAQERQLKKQKATEVAKSRHLATLQRDLATLQRDLKAAKEEAKNAQVQLTYLKSDEV